MSLESQLEANTAALVALTTAIAVLGGERYTQVTQQQPTQTFVVPAPLVPQVQPTTTFGAQPQATPGAMPGTPFGTAPAAGGFNPAPAPVVPQAPVAGGAPFTELKGLLEYGQHVYGILEKKGPGRGAILEELLKHFQADSMNTLNPAHYGAFYAEAEKLTQAP